MSQGLEQVEAALKRIERALDAIGELGGVQETWRSEATARLTATEALLRVVTDRFFLKTKVCVPFTGKCEKEAANLAGLLAELGAEPAPDGQERLDAALEALEQAAKTLNERSLMRGMAIT